MVKRKRIPLLMVLPVLIYLFALTIVPLVYMWVLSFSEYNLSRSEQMSFVGLRNYFDAFQDTEFYNSLTVTLIYVAAAVGIEFVLGFAIALLLSKDFRGVGVFRTIIIMPMMCTPVVAGLVWRYIFSPEIGMANYLLSILKIPKLVWLGDPNLAVVSVVLVDIWQWTPFVVLVLIAGILSLPNEPYEAALIDGASSWQLFRYITVPLLRNVILITVLLRVIDAFKIFDQIWVLTRGGPALRTEVLSIFIYRIGLRFFSMGRAAVLSIMMLFVVIGLSQILIILIRRRA
ncbi:Trehalose transport system permease protein SugA [subsurface metagenome]